MADFDIAPLSVAFIFWCLTYIPADRSRVDCPLPEGRGYRKGMPALAGRQSAISLKGEASDHKGGFDEQT
jgi:hypothetical protein